MWREFPFQNDQIKDFNSTKELNVILTPLNTLILFVFVYIIAIK